MYNLLNIILNPIEEFAYFSLIFQRFMLITAVNMVLLI